MQGKISKVRSVMYKSSQKTRQNAEDILDSGQTGGRAFLPFLGPALVASIAYMDPGNFATNIQAGANFGYKLLWVVLFANITAMLFQALSARIGIVTGKNLAELSREVFPKPVNLCLWILSEISAIATDLAEFLGATIAFNLLFGIPMLWGALLTGLITYGFLIVHDRGFRPIEIIIGIFIALLGICFMVELTIARPDWVAVAKNSFVPSIAGKESILLIVGIIGATVMPHALFLHSALTQNRVRPKSEGARRALIKWSNVEVIVVLSFAGLVNMAMLIMAAATFHDGVHNDIASIETAYQTLIPLLGAAAGIIFLIALLASGLSSSVVGTMAGQVVMQGFINFRIPLIARRLITMLPAIIVIWYGFDTTLVLVLSQVVLSFVLPAPLILLLIFSAKASIMGKFMVSRWILALCGIASVLIITLNALLILLFFKINVI